MSINTPSTTTILHVPPDILKHHVLRPLVYFGQLQSEE